MPSPNLKDILRSSILDKRKMLLLAMGYSRPQLSKVTSWLLRPFTRKGEVRIRYRDHGRLFTVFVRESDRNSDYLSVRELIASHVYKLDPGFDPDLVIDGGGNIGMFTLLAEAIYPQSRKVVCEPVPKNLRQLTRHMDVNGASVEIEPVCIGGSRRTIPFYVREANQGSFDPSKPFETQIDVPVVTLADLTADPKAKRILIKLDIEGMETEALEGYIPQETRTVQVHGELHDHKTNGERFRNIFERHGWTISFEDVTDAGSLFKAVSPGGA